MLLLFFFCLPLLLWADDAYMISEEAFVVERPAKVARPMVRIARNPSARLTHKSRNSKPAAVVAMLPPRRAIRVVEK